MQLPTAVRFDLMTREQLASAVGQFRNELGALCGGLDLNDHEKQLANGAWLNAVKEYKERTKLSLFECVTAVRAHLWTMR